MIAWLRRARAPELRHFVCAAPVASGVLVKHKDVIGMELARAAAQPDHAREALRVAPREQRCALRSARLAQQPLAVCERALTYEGAQLLAKALEERTLAVRIALRPRVRHSSV